MNNKKFYIHFPIFILLAEWVIVLYLHYNNPYHFIVMSSDTLMIVFLGLMFIVLGYYLVNSFYLYRDNLLPGDRKEVTIDEAFLGKFIIVFTLLSFLGFLLVALEIAKVTNNFSMYFENPFFVRERIVSMQQGEIAVIDSFRYKIGAYLCSFMYPMSSLGGMLAGMRSKWKYISILPLLLMVAYSVLNMNRFGLIAAMGLWFFSLIYYGMFVRKKRRKALSVKTSVYLLMGILFISTFFYLIISLRAFSDVNLAYYAKRSVYSYISGSGAAFEKFTFDHHPLLYGASSFRSVVKWFARLGLMDSGLVMGAHNKFYNISHGMPMNLNTYTFVKSPYEDFGLIGVAVICLSWGMAARYILEKCIRQFSIWRLFLVALMILSFLMSFYEFFFQSITMFAYWLIILYLVEKYFHSKKVIRNVAI
ncbi:MAG: O-antigen polymerase [Bacteroidales bacterium]